MSFHTGSQQPSQPGLQPTTEPKPKQQGISKEVVALLVALAVVLIGGGILFAFVGVIQPNQQHAQATATAQTKASQATGTAQANANATATILATATAHAIATTTALQGIYTQATSGNPTLNDPSLLKKALQSDLTFIFTFPLRNLIKDHSAPAVRNAFPNAFETGLWYNALVES